MATIIKTPFGDYKDKDGVAYPYDLLGKKFFHTKTQRLYNVTEIVWCGDTDRWMVFHSREGINIRFVRSFKNFTGNFESGKKRFVEVLG